MKVNKQDNQSPTRCHLISSTNTFRALKALVNPPLPPSSLTQTSIQQTGSHTPPPLSLFVSNIPLLSCSFALMIGGCWRNMMEWEHSGILKPNVFTPEQDWRKICLRISLIPCPTSSLMVNYGIFTSLFKIVIAFVHLSLRH